MKTLAAALVVFAVIGLLMPAPASAATFTYSCSPATQPAPANWLGGPWSGPVRLVVDTTAHMIELLDSNYVILATTARSGRLSGLNNYQMDVSVTDNVISWGVIEMWGFSGYIDRRSGRLDVTWVNQSGYNTTTFNRQFHGMCTAS
jgi:hypothetical protein